MDFSFSPDQLLLRDTVQQVMAKVATPEYVRRLDQEQAYPYELYDAWVEVGLLGVPFPQEYGGWGGSVIDMVIVAEELAKTSYDLFGAYNGSVFCGLSLLKNGSKEQQAHWIPRILSGQTRMTVSMSEPDAGSDVGAMRTKATLEGERWRIHGQKLWSSGAGARNNVINLYARSRPEGRHQQGISLFLVDNDAPGVTLRKLDMLGRRSVGTYEVFFDDVALDDSRLVGGAHCGWDCMMACLQYERITGVAAYVGGAQAVVDLATAHARERRQFGRPIGSFQAVAHMLADMQTEVEAARALMWRAAWMVSAGQDALREISMAKLFASETYVKAANLGMQIMGAYGYSMEYDMQRYFRDARGATIAGGTSQIQRNLIARTMGLKVET
jgi:alkylation response protein AidB-like acyl-CoA dehydrogenase